MRSSCEPTDFLDAKTNLRLINFGERQISIGRGRWKERSIADGKQTCLNVYRVKHLPRVAAGGNISCERNETRQETHATSKISPTGVMNPTGVLRLSRRDETLTGRQNRVLPIVVSYRWPCKCSVR